MKKRSNLYIIFYASVIIVVAAVLLALAATALAPRQRANEELEKQSAILAAVGIGGNNVAELYGKYITETTLHDVLPLYEAKIDDTTTLFIIPVEGKGLWGPIWGYVALESDWNTIYGVTFAHKGETPGLGAEIATADFAAQFKGKKITRNSDFVGIELLKGRGSSVGNENAVDAVSGGTLTSKGVQAMLFDGLSEYYKLANED